MKGGISLQWIAWAAIIATLFLAEVGFLAVNGAVHLP